MKKNRIYFASDFHLGSPNLENSHARERIIVSWLDEIKHNAAKIYLLGDIFDFWFEYNKVVPKGFVRILGKLAELNEEGIKVYLITGNHDMWAKDYLEKEIGVKIFYKNTIINEHNKKILIGHGDGLGNGDYLYKLIKLLFTSNICRWIFARFHPNFGITIAHIWSKKSKNKKEKHIDPNKDPLINYCKNIQKSNPVDYYIFGHRHIPIELFIEKETQYINTGDWISHNTYAVLNNGVLKLKKYTK